jgi:hypothetical protein
MFSNTGIIQGFYSGQQDRVDELNARIQSRFIPDNELRPNYDPRPVSTKYSLFPVIDRKTPGKEYLKPSTEYLGEGDGFKSLITNSPFIRNIDTETVLRNQTVALQNGIGQSLYVPSSNSDLYNTTIVSRPSEQPFPNLFIKPTFNSTQPAISITNQNIGKSDLFNYTRFQLRNT